MKTMNQLELNSACRTYLTLITQMCLSTRGWKCWKVLMCLSHLGTDTAQLGDVSFLLQGGRWKYLPPTPGCWRLNVVSHRWAQQTFFSTEEVSAVFQRLSKGRSWGQAWRWDQQRFNKVSSEKHSEPSIRQSSRRDIQDRGVPRFLWSWDSCCEHLGGKDRPQKKLWL